MATTKVQQIGDLERVLRDAMLGPDAKVLEDITASDFTWTHSNGNVDPRAAWLERLRSAQTRYTRLDTSAVEVRTYGDTTLVSGRLDMMFVSGAGEKAVPMRFLRVWVRTDDGWRLAAHSSTRLPE